MEVKHVEGIKKGSVLLYALSTCVWCKKTKGLLDELGVDYSYIYVDQLSEDDTEQVINEVKNWNPECTFPTIVINNDKCIVGFKALETAKRQKSALKDLFNKKHARTSTNQTTLFMVFADALLAIRVCAEVSWF